VSEFLEKGFRAFYLMGGESPHKVGLKGLDSFRASVGEGGEGFNSGKKVCKTRFYLLENLAGGLGEGLEAKR